MYEFQTSHLYRVSLDFSDIWPKPKDTSPFYIVERSKEQAKELVERHLDSRVKVKSVSKLAKSLSNHIYRGK